jgi:hypothetical protein
MSITTKHSRYALRLNHSRGSVLLLRLAFVCGTELMFKKKESNHKILLFFVFFFCHELAEDVLS